MEVLGVLLCSVHDVASPPLFRLNKATSSFWAAADFFKCQGIHIQRRFDEFHKRVIPVATYGSAAWIWSKELLHLCTRWENSLLRQIVGYKRVNGDGHFATIQKLTHKARALYHSTG
eukprot:9150040-Karenia_brevis.AAC.1